ncbi:MAG: replicative DNA helicase [Chloroflexi bacterium]|nr:replicative DNA helicase [Chloroflexota bacterium]
MYADRLPPHDDEAEEAVLGSVLINGETLPDVASYLQASDFYREKNRWCYEACLALFDRNDPINLITIADELSRQGRLEEVGGLPYLNHLIGGVPSSVYASHYGQLVRRFSVMRKLIDAGGRIAAIGYGAELEADEAMRKAEDELYRLRLGHSTRDLLSLREALDQYLEQGLYAGVPRGGLPSGFSDLDKLLGGLQPSDMLILAARPGMGKSALALNMARNVAREGRTVAMFSLEMAREQVVERLLATESGVTTHRLRLGNWTDTEEEAVQHAAGQLAELSIYIDDSPLLGIVEMRSKARRLHMEQGLDLIVIDYLQLMQGSTAFGGNRVQEISEISRSLKGLARDLNVPLLAVSQLSRAVEGRPSHEPILSDLRESGSIEQDADVVAFIYRPDFYFTEEEWERRFPSEEYPKGIADIIVAKHRHGPMGRLQLLFRDRTTTFLDLYRDQARPRLV